MDAEFWLERWSKNQIGFHEGEPNTLLTQTFDRLQLEQGSHVFAPLSGKSVDLAWIAAQGHRVTGIDLSLDAARAFFAEVALEAKEDAVGPLIRLYAGDVALFAGDIFDLRGDILGPVDAIYDRAALVALPADMRPRYASHLTELTNTAPQLLITFDYDQSRMAGPPFSLSHDMVSNLYAHDYAITQAATRPVTGPMAARTGGATEAALHLIPHP